MNEAQNVTLAQPAHPRRSYTRVTPEIERRIVELYAAGHRTEAIAEAVGCSRASVYNHLPEGAR